MSEELWALIEKARHIQLTADELREQEIGFAYGNAHFENPLVTREMAEQALPDEYDIDLEESTEDRAARA